jgi:hypothetical protein
MANLENLQGRHYVEDGFINAQRRSYFVKIILQTITKETIVDKETNFTIISFYKDK